MKKICILVLIVLITACTTKKITDQERTAHYQKIENTMATYYEEYYLEIKEDLPRDKDVYVLTVTLEELKDNKYDISSFVNIDTNELCSLTDSRAVIVTDFSVIAKDNYIIDIYFKCGNYEHKVH